MNIDNQDFLNDDQSDTIRGSPMTDLVNRLKLRHGYRNRHNHTLSKTSEYKTKTSAKKKESYSKKKIIKSFMHWSSNDPNNQDNTFTRLAHLSLPKALPSDSKNQDDHRSLDSCKISSFSVHNGEHIEKTTSFSVHNGEHIEKTTSSSKTTTTTSYPDVSYPKLNDSTN